MTHDLQSAGGLATPASAAKTGFDAADAAQRIDFALNCATDMAQLCTALQGLTAQLYKHDSNPLALACNAIVDRVERLGNAVLSALGDELAPIADLQRRMKLDCTDQDGLPVEPCWLAQTLSDPLAHHISTTGSAA